MNRGSGSNLLKIILLAFCLSASPFSVSAQNNYFDDDNNSYSQGELSQLLAPIALYPDQLVGQILMASTYPLDVVEAQRWLQIPQNSALHGDQLAAALEQQDWDPSVKSLVQFPQIISMLDKNIKWTQSLGDAFLDDEDGVMDTIQQLRAQAQASGALAPNAQQNISVIDREIIIEPVNPQVIYIPYYNPTVVYGRWAYPDYPPYYFQQPRGVVYSNSYISYGTAVSVIPLYWGWNRWDWHQRRIYIDNDRYRRINHNRQPVFIDVWRHDPSHRGGVPYHRNRVNHTETRTPNPEGNFAKPRRNHNYAAPQAAPVVAAPQIIYGTPRKTMTPQVPSPAIPQAAPEKPMQQAVPLNPAPVVATPPANNENHQRQHRERHSGRGFQAVPNNTQNTPVVNKEITTPQRHGEANKHHEGEREHRRDNRSNNADNPTNDNAPRIQK